MKILKRAQFPQYAKRFKEIKGICIGGCIDPDDHMAKEHVAHAHSCSGPFQGWICFRYKYYLNKLTLLHEVAHLMANKSRLTPPHGKKWKQALLSIGGTYKSFCYSYKNKILKNLDYTYRNRKW